MSLIDTSAPHRPLVKAVAVLFAALALMWAAGLNGQPFFTPDTQAYVRGPDVAVVKLLGARFASPWARQEPPGAHVTAPQAGAKTAAPQHSYDDKEVLAGRSIYYGALAYLGQLTGGFWLTVFVQALAVAWLAEIALRAARQPSLAAYAAAIAVTALATPAPFFIADLMPDIWSGVAIGAMALLLALPRRLARVDVAVLAAMTAFAAMAHNSHVLIIAGMMAAGVALWLLNRKAAANPLPGLAVGALALACAVGGALAFSAMVKRSVGAPPITPPFLTARVVADGPGRLYAAEHCKDHPFAVCAFADRLAATDTDGFLWDVDPRTGVFAVATPEQRRALATEQTRFALASTLAHPLQQARASADNVALQLVQTDLEDFDYKPNVLAELRADLPPVHRARLERSLAARRGWPIAQLWAEQAAAIWLAVALILCSLLSSRFTRLEDRRLPLYCGLGVLANTVVCGVLSDLYGRYQARAIWVLPLAAVVLALPLLSRARVRRAGPRTVWTPRPV